jgi:hypothetical protein
MRICTGFLAALLVVCSAGSRADAWSESYRLESMGQYKAAAELFDPVLKTQQALQTAPWNYYAHLRLMVAEKGQRQWQTLELTAKLHQRYPSDATVWCTGPAPSTGWATTRRPATHTDRFCSACRGISKPCSSWPGGVAVELRGIVPEQDVVRFRSVYLMARILMPKLLYLA